MMSLEAAEHRAECSATRSASAALFDAFGAITTIG
jgi:hypothetical protein